MRVVKARGLAFFLFLSGTASHASDFSVEPAKKMFLICEGCHTMDGSSYQSIAPDLANIENRIAGTNIGFVYSEAMLAAGRNGLVWNEETLLSFLANPKAMVVETKMKFKGIHDEGKRKHLVKWLLKASRVRD